MVAGDKRRSAVNIEVKPLSYFTEICQRAKNNRDSCLIALLYLSGRRIGEILHLTKEDVHISNGYMSFETFNEKCFRRNSTGIFSIKLGILYYEKINVSFSTETELYQKLSPYIFRNLEEIKDEDYIFHSFRGSEHIGTVRAYQIITVLAPETWPHWYRHQRFSQVSELLKELNVVDALPLIRQFTKHHRTDSDLAYIHRTQNQEILRKI